MKLALIITALLFLNFSLSILAMGADLSTIKYGMVHQRDLEENYKKKVKTNEELLFTATVTSNYEEVKKLLDKGTNPNYTNFSKESPLHWAAAKGNMPITQLLLTHGAFIDPLSEGNSTPLSFACFFGNHEVVKLLVEHGANVNYCNHYKKTILHYASMQSIRDFKETHLKIIEYLLQQGANIDAKDKGGKTALERAKEMHNNKIVNLLKNYSSKQLILLNRFVNHIDTPTISIEYLLSFQRK